jgi:hypothetical protein
MNAPRKVEKHHVGGHLYGRLVVDLEHDAHAILTKEQAAYAHLLRRANLPVQVAVALVLFDLSALLEMVGKELRRLGHLLLKPLPLTAWGRAILRHPRAAQEDDHAG